MFDFDLNFDEDEIPTQKSVTRNRFDLSNSAKDLIDNADILPHENESVRLISPIAGFSSCSLVMALSEMCRIDSIKITTLRVGKKNFPHLWSWKSRALNFVYAICKSKMQMRTIMRITLRTFAVKMVTVFATSITTAKLFCLKRLWGKLPLKHQAISTKIQKLSSFA